MAPLNLSSLRPISGPRARSFPFLFLSMHQPSPGQREIKSKVNGLDQTPTDEKLWLNDSQAQNEQKP